MSPFNLKIDLIETSKQLIFCEHRRNYLWIQWRKCGRKTSVLTCQNHITIIHFYSILFFCWNVYFKTNCWRFLSQRKNSTTLIFFHQRSVLNFSWWPTSNCYKNRDTYIKSRQFYWKIYISSKTFWYFLQVLQNKWFHHNKGR